MQLIKNAKKLRLWVLSHGRVPSSHMANKVYRWVDPDGRPTTPPPDPFEIQDQVSKGEQSLMSDADERKVCTHMILSDDFEFLLWCLWIDASR